MMNLSPRTFLAVCFTLSVAIALPFQGAAAARPLPSPWAPFLRPNMSARGPWHQARNLVPAGNAVRYSAAAQVFDLGASFIPDGLNAKDEVVGNIFDASVQNSVPHAGLWSNGVLTPLPEQPGAIQSDAYAINQAGRIVGGDTVPSKKGNDFHAIFWNGVGPPTQVGPIASFGPGSDGSQANGVDAAGDVVGETVGPSQKSFQETGFVSKNGGPPSTAGRGDSGVDGSSDIGAITPDGRLLLGWASTSTSFDYYLWPGASPNAAGVRLDLHPMGSGFTVLGGAPGGLMINDLASDGTVIGYKDSSGTPVVRTKYIRLPTGAETPLTRIGGVNAVNAKHVVAGTIPAGNTIHAAIWQNGEVTDLNTLLPANSGFTLFDALAINDNGDIVGIAGHNNQQVGFLLKPASAEVTSVLPEVGSAAGGDLITIIGSGLKDATEVQFVPQGFGSEKDAYTVTVPVSAAYRTDETISIPSAPDMTAAVHANVGSHKENTSVKTDILITLKSGDGTVTTTTPSSQDEYTFSLPEVTKVSPGVGSMYGETTLTVDGKYLYGAAGVSFDPYKEVNCGRSDPMKLPPGVDEPVAHTASIGQPDYAHRQVLTLKPTPSFENIVKVLHVPAWCGIGWDVSVEIPVKGTCGRLDRLCEFLTSPKNQFDDTFVTDPLAVTSVRPTSGPILADNKTITIKGAGFDFGGYPKVEFMQVGSHEPADAVPAGKVGVVSDDEIRAVVPEFAWLISRLGLVDLSADVVVTEALGPKGAGTTIQSDRSSADQYQVEGPDVTSVNPAKVGSAGGQIVDVKGRGFTGALKVEFLRFGTKKPISANTSEAFADVDVVSDDELTFRVPNVTNLVDQNKGPFPVHVVVGIPVGVQRPPQLIKSVVNQHDKLTFTR